MAYAAYRCKKCQKTSLFAFENEFKKDTKCVKCSGTVWVKLPPNPTTIHQTDGFMSEPILDSMASSIELDRILRMEEGHEIEQKITNEARKKI